MLLKGLGTFAEIILYRKEAREYNVLSIHETIILKGQPCLFWGVQFSKEYRHYEFCMYIMKNTLSLSIF